MHEVLVNRLGGLSLSRKSVLRLIDRPDMTLDVQGIKQEFIKKVVTIFDKLAQMNTSVSVHP